MSSTVLHHTGRTRAHAPGEFRTDIQGMRAVAVGLVLLYHANVGVFSGGFIGVDVFFVISGFLITGLLIREVEKTGRIDLVDFYARRIRRILPAATVVLVVTLLLTVAILPPTRWSDTAREAIASALYVANWVFASGTGYESAGAAVSPLQHFWTLSVEEQFYIVWPLLLIVTLLVTKRRSRRDAATNFRRTAMLGVLFVIVPSLAWSVYDTAASPEAAYFVTTTRVWELALGAAVALTSDHLQRISHVWGLALGWVGAIVLLAVSVTYTVSAPPFPGASALLPTLATVALIIAGMNGRSGTGVGAFLSTRPMRWLGDISYSLYLWHWPLIVCAAFMFGGALPPVWGVAVCLFAVLPAWLSYRCIEEPFRAWGALQASSWRAIRAGGAMIAITCVAAAATFTMTATLAGRQPIAVSPLGARALTSDMTRDTLESFGALGTPTDIVEDGIAPPAMKAREDNAQRYGDNKCHLEFEDTDPTNCVFGDPNSDTEVVLVGDSHAANWAPAMIDIAQQRGLALTIHTKSGCSFVRAEQTKYGKPYRECSEWIDKVYHDITEEPPDLVITSNAGRRGIIEDDTVLHGSEKEDALKTALEETWEGLTSIGAEVVVIADTPDMGHDVAECVSANPRKLTKCATPREEALERIPRPELEVAEKVDGVTLIEMDNWVCPHADTCPAVVGNTLVWRDSHHLTQTYAESLAEPLAEKLAGAGVLQSTGRDRAEPVERTEPVSDSRR